MDSDSFSTFSAVTPPVPRGPDRFPALVGMDVERARAIVEWAGYYVHTQTYKQTRGYVRPAMYDKEGNVQRDAWRVILWLDNHGCVALTPTVG